MLPHQSSGGASPPMDLAWLEERALRYVARWETSAASVATLLERKILARCETSGESPAPVLEKIPALVIRLVERGYVDDHRFAANTLERQRRRGGSTAQIRARLASKGISELLIGELLAKEAPETEFRAAWKLARRRRLGPFCDDPALRRRSRERHLSVLCRQGFDPDMARKIVDADEIREFEP